MNPLSSSTPIALFDFDHTLTDRDSLVPFLYHLFGKWKVNLQFTLMSLDILLFLMGIVSRQTIKEKILTRFFKAQSFSTLQLKGKIYAETQLDRFLKPEALARLKWHIQQGHRCLLVSASLEAYLIPWASKHGFEKVLGSRLHLTNEGIVTGLLEGKNCWGPEKVTRLKDYLGSLEGKTLYVYGDSRGDKEMLELATYPFYQTFS